MILDLIASLTYMYLPAFILDTNPDNIPPSRHIEAVNISKSDERRAGHDSQYLESKLNGINPAYCMSSHMI